MGSTVKIEHSTPFGVPQNLTKSSSCRSEATTTAGSGAALMSRINLSPVLACCIITNSSSPWPSLNFNVRFAFVTCISPLGSPGALAPITPPTFADTEATTSLGPVSLISCLIIFIVLGHVAKYGLLDQEFPCG